MLIVVRRGVTRHEFYVRLLFAAALLLDVLLERHHLLELHELLEQVLLVLVRLGLAMVALSRVILVAALHFVEHEAVLPLGSRTLIHQVIFNAYFETASFFDPALQSFLL